MFFYQKNTAPFLKTNTFLYVCLIYEYSFIYLFIRLLFIYYITTLDYFSLVYIHYEPNIVLWFIENRTFYNS